MSFFEQWARPVDVFPYPKVWLEFEVKESLNSDKLVKYRIQDLPEDRFEEVLKYMWEIYVPEESILTAVGALKDEVYKNEFELMVRGSMGQKMSLVCFREGSDEIIGANILLVLTKQGQDSGMQQARQIFKSKCFEDLMKVYEKVYAKFNPYEKYGVNEYLGSMGLLVLPKYRGLGMGTKLVEARKLLAAPFNLKISHTHFTSDHSNKIADRLGFQVDLAVTFDELKADNPSLNLDDVDSKGYFVKTWKF